MRNTLPQSKGPLYGYFNAEQTTVFLTDLDSAIRTLEHVPVIRVLIEYGVLMKEEILVFQKAYQDLIEKLHRHDTGSVAVRNVNTRESRCIACEYKKKMTVYEFEFFFPEADEMYNTVVYRYDFGVFYDISDGALYDLGICNGILSRCEMQKKGVSKYKNYINGFKRDI